MSFSDNINEIAPESRARTAIEQVYRDLHRAILVGDIAPETRLRVEDLRQKLGVGASTVREALSRLLVENLVTTEGQRGFRSAAASLKDFKSIVEMRAMLEARAVRASIELGDEAWENAFVAAHHHLARIETDMPIRDKQRVAEWEMRNRAFHNAMIAACENDWLLNFRGILYNHSVRYLRISIADRSIPRDVRGEHQAIFDAVVSRDADLAEKLTIEHIHRTVPAIEASLTAKASERQSD
ncbi:GntR family transcriptional regulator [Celeribacter sp. SCSIO 80788]|uniref:GntR family transcriptional regulator n=1 Tax=Celeribacter sp. SCSIO 80788 TaxID=3117013 RepID=UPI003DA6716F